MVIKRRDGSKVVLPGKAPKTKSKAKAPKEKKIPASREAVPRVSVSGIKRRRATSSRYVYVDGGALVVRTPAECTKWPNDFRRYLVSEYIPPKTLKALSEMRVSEKAPPLFNIAGCNVSVRHPYEDVGAGQAVVLCTRVINHDTGKSLFLNHDNPAMRVLMVYAFLHSAEIGGLPKLIIDDADL